RGAGRPARRARLAVRRRHPHRPRRLRGLPRTAAARGRRAAAAARTGRARPRLRLARHHGMATVYTDSDEHPNVADPTADFVYARLMRSRAHVASGYPADELAAWAARARTWARGGTPGDLPLLAPPAAAVGLLRLLGARPG